MKPNHRVHEPIIECQSPVYRCMKAVGKPGVLDGNIEKDFWKRGEWIEDFHDIEGDTLPLPWKHTQVKMLWDEEALYVAARLDDDTIWATVEERDRIIYVDNDFEVFLAPQDTSHRYYELEMNANNAVWDLMMEKPMRDCVKRIIGWDIKGLESAVKICGEINNPSADNKYWSLEIKIPWFSLRECPLDSCWPPKMAPEVGDIWRMNFSRVEYDVDIVDNKYVKRCGEDGRTLPEHNWVWAPTGVIDIHMPEMWGYLIFTENGEDEYPIPVYDAAKLALYKLYYREHKWACEHGSFTDDVMALIGDVGKDWNVKVYTTPSMFEGIIEFLGKTYHIRQDGFFWEDDYE